MSKPHLSYQAQAELLQERGLLIKDPREAEAFLRTVNYYYLRGYYTDCFDSSSNHFSHGLRWEELTARVLADRSLRRIYFYYLEDIEFALRTTISYHLSKNYGPIGYKNPSNFRDEARHKKFLEVLDQSITRSSELFIGHFQNQQRLEIPDMPIWAAVELLTFGSLSKHLYGMLKARDQKEISRCLLVNSKAVLISYLRCLTLLRNRCAHHSRLYNRILTDPCRISDEHRTLVAKLAPGFDINPNSLFCYTLALIHLLPICSKARFAQELYEFDNDFPCYDLGKCDFPSNWQSILSELC